MKQPADYQSFSPALAANRNGNAESDDELIEHITAQRDRVAVMLNDPRLTGQHRENMEMFHARAERWLKEINAHRFKFRQARLLARMRQP